ncbi:AAA family ATPase [Micromonospora sp. M51]|uniref:AAA family ATPase n=1 Tax=Micromonospora sp. M51 TaxID=2824889 RepID=UPI001B388629|nr:AAA family ATPase [Micromonospora sp. M51]MBQ1009373.1 AAA family ATPase [Micromonospora sp. M51]
MTWESCYRGDGVPRGVKLPEPPPWRTFPRRPLGTAFQPPEGLTDAVNAALCLRRPLLVTGAPGAGKSTLIESVAAELQLGRVLRWHVTSRSTLAEALYRYDVLGRIHAQQLARGSGRSHGSLPRRFYRASNSAIDIAPFLQLGPLGTALLPTSRPRALLIDEIDKSDLDLPSDLLDVLERGAFEIPELARYDRDAVNVREWGGDTRHAIVRGQVACTEFPFIVMTSNGERDFPAPFLRRCVRFAMPEPTVDMTGRIVAAHLGAAAGSQAVADLVSEFVTRVRTGENLAVDQLLSVVFLLAGDGAAKGEQRDRIRRLVMRELSRV